MTLRRVNVYACLVCGAPPVTCMHGFTEAFKPVLLPGIIASQNAVTILYLPCFLCATADVQA